MLVGGPEEMVLRGLFRDCETSQKFVSTSNSNIYSGDLGGEAGCPDPERGVVAGPLAPHHGALGLRGGDGGRGHGADRGGARLLLPQVPARGRGLVVGVAESFSR